VKKFFLMFLPPYSPELNLIERVWKLTRWLATHNRHFPSLGHVVEAVLKRFNLCAKPNRQLARLYAII
jgi:transposase